MALVALLLLVDVAEQDDVGALDQVSLDARALVVGAFLVDALVPLLVPLAVALEPPRARLEPLVLLAGRVLGDGVALGHVVPNARLPVLVPDHVAVLQVLLLLARVLRRFRVVLALGVLPQAKELLARDSVLDLLADHGRLAVLVPIALLLVRRHSHRLLIADVLVEVVVRAVPLPAVLLSLNVAAPHALAEFRRDRVEVVIQAVVEPATILTVPIALHLLVEP